MHIFLVGMPASGKTTFGRPYAAAKGLCFVDLDAEIVHQQDATISQIFEAVGEEGFRQIERDTLKNLDFSEAMLLATGGGTPCFYDNMAFMRTKGCVLWIDTPLYSIKKRLSQDTARPLFQNENIDEIVEKLYRERKPFYEKAHFRCV
jgi:shikimate kinase